MPFGGRAGRAPKDDLRPRRAHRFFSQGLDHVLEFLFGLSRKSPHHAPKQIGLRFLALQRIGYVVTGALCGSLSDFQ